MMKKVVYNKGELMKDYNAQEMRLKLRPDEELTGGSVNWANWMSRLSITTCKYCACQHGKVVDISAIGGRLAVLAHLNCRCVYVPMRTAHVGTVSEWGIEGADAYLYHLGHLPDYYVDSKTAEQAGWRKREKKFSKLFPGKMLGGDEYENDDLKLPSAPGRKWYEADINYGGGKRNRDRVVYSNDGLMFVTYDHYYTFYEITP